MHFVRAAAEAFNTSTTHVSFAGKAFLSKEIVRLVAEAGMFVDTCTMGEMRIALAAGVPGRRLVLHGMNAATPLTVSPDWNGIRLRAFGKGR